MESRPAIDGQAGSVLRCYREHQMSADDAFLRRNWEKIRKAVQFIINQDRNGDGMEKRAVAGDDGHAVSVLHMDTVMLWEFSCKPISYFVLLLLLILRLRREVWI
jgi:hypothetical protein